MSNSILQTNVNTKSYQSAIPGNNPISAFISWCTQQQENRLLWLAIALAGQGCVITPITLAAGMWNGIDMTAYTVAIVAIVMNVIVNLAALPTRVTIPVFFLSILMDMAILVYFIS